jgi:hypothetical protein
VHEFNVLALIKGQDRYIFVFDDPSRPKVIDAFRDLAADPALSLTWFDAVILTNKVREEAAQKIGDEEETAPSRFQS